LRLALEIEKSDISTSLQKIEKASFDVTGARWAIKGGIISVSLYPEQPETVFAIHAGAKCSTDVEAVFLIQEKIKEMMASLACKDGDCDVIWNSGGGVSKLQ
jgi:hypothetical protein